jgi:predicted esterase
MLGLLVACENSPEEGTVWEGHISHYRMVVEGFDWGPGTTALILDLGDETIDPSEINADDFAVSVLHQNNWLEDEVGQKRTILAVYASDALGNEVATKASFITIELEVNPHAGNPFFFFLDDGRMGNMWAEPYVHTITYQGIESQPERGDHMMPLTDLYNLDGEFTGSDDIFLQYAYYQPETGDNQPLIIWLHGGGEGSLDETVGTEIALLGNRVTQLVNPEIQDIFGGAYILVPQTGTRWLNSGNWEHVNGESRYETALIELIEVFIAENPNIDTNRIYIGGGSNGGFMALRVLFSRPDLIAASLPICIYFDPDVISDEDIAAVVDIPMWLVHDINDPTTPFEHTQSLYDRLLEAGATNVQLTDTNGIYDTTGQFFDEKGGPHRYNDHWTWIPVLNNEIEAQIDGETITIFEWLATQSR